VAFLEAPQSLADLITTLIALNGAGLIVWGLRVKFLAAAEKAAANAEKKVNDLQDEVDKLRGDINNALNKLARIEGRLGIGNNGQSRFTF
jgi:peptidoglycan hydrolase CwlO-like protein